MGAGAPSVSLEDITQLTSPHVLEEKKTTCFKAKVLRFQPTGGRGCRPSVVGTLRVVEAQGAGWVKESLALHSGSSAY